MSNEDNAILEQEEWIEEMFEDIRDNAWPGFYPTFVESLKSQFEERGRLTEKQIAALENIHEAVMDRADR